MSLSSLGEYLLIDHLFPYLYLSSLLALTCTSRFYARICSDPILWKRKLERDFNYFPSSDTARISGFKLIYKGLHRPQVYLWGHLASGRRGELDATPPTNHAYMYPVQLKMNRRIVTLVPSGWSYHAIDENGNIYIWGTLNGLEGERRVEEGMAFSESHCTASVPTQLELPTRFTAISCGRIHATALDSKHRVWIFNRWGRPNLLTFTGTLEDQRRRNPLIANTKIIQVACGYYSFVAFLTDDGRVFISWTTDREFLRQDTAMNTALDEADNGVSGRLVSGVIKCAPIPIDVDATLIPELPSDLPKLHNPEGEDDDDGRAPKIVKIAAGRAFIVALTDHGHVLRFDLSGGIVPEDVEELKNDILSNVRQWTYLPQLCEIEDVKEDPNFRPEVDGQPITVSQQDFKITHVSAHMDSAVVYSTGAFSTVIVAGMTMVRGGGRHMQRTILPELQNKNIISVTASEYHYAALDTNGTVYTWGTDLCGSLGLGLLDRTADGFPAVGASVSEPTPVQIHPNNPGRRTFCFSLTAAGWHTAALGFDLDDHCDPMEGPVSSPEQPVASTSQRQSSWRFWKR